MKVYVVTKESWYPYDTGSCTKVVAAFTSESKADDYCTKQPNRDNDGAHCSYECTEVECMI